MKATDELRLIVSLEDMSGKGKMNCLRLLTEVDEELARLCGGYAQMAHQMIASGVPTFVVLGRSILARVEQ